MKNLLFKIRRRGVRGTVSSALRQLSECIEPQTKGTTDNPAPVGPDYLAFVRYATGGWPTPGNHAAIDYALCHMPADASMLEIGTFCGQSACALVHLAEQHGVGSLVFTCDIWRYDEGINFPATLLGGGPGLTFADYNRFVRESYIRNAAFFCGERRPYSIETDSDNFFKSWASGSAMTDVFGRSAPLGGPLGLAFVDGNHYYEGIVRDFQNIDRWLLTGGFILFDDSADDSPWPDVRRLVREIVAGGRYSVVKQSPNYLLQKK